jgi:cytochrome c biogenesis protein CcmG/thiol:disulfide interchange protein DsbE
MRKTILVFISVLFVIIPLISCERGKEQGASTESNGPYAKNFSLYSLDGNKKVELKNFKGKPVVINFWASWCGPCREEMPFFEKTWDEYKDKGTIFLGINVLDEEKNAKDFVHSFGISYTNLRDSSGETANAYSVAALPATFFIDKGGKIVKRSYGGFVGKTGETNFRNYIEEIMK